MAMLKIIHPEFDGFGVSAMDTESGILSGRPYGGIGLLWRKSISNACTVKRYDDPRLLVMTVETNQGKYFLLNVYMPYQCHDNYDDYCNYIGKLLAIVEECDTANIVIAGDFNAAVNTPFENELMQMCSHAHLVISDYDWFGRQSGVSTYMSAAHNTTSWLDHVICSHSTNLTIDNINVHELPPSSDHHPLGVTFTVRVVANGATNTANTYGGKNNRCLTGLKHEIRI
jgi:exonuclease III